jgi:hypothetical protein
VHAEADEEGGGPGPDLGIPTTPDAVQRGPGSPYGTIHDNPIFKAKEMDNLDDSYNNEPLRFRSMSELIGPTEPEQVPRELSTSEGDRLFGVSAEEPTSAMEATKEAVWHRAMVAELQSIEENKIWSLTNFPTDRRAIGLKWVFKVKKNLLDYSIKGPLALPYHLCFMVGVAEEGHLAWYQSRGLEFNFLWPRNFSLRVFHPH